MGIELPAELADIAARTGVSWPEADEDGMREQAEAWRRAAGELNTLATDADAVAGKALGTMAGPAAESARERWSGFAEPDSGALSVAARGADQAAQRLDDAAEQVGAAKVELVRQLVDAARNSDAAVAAADSGHPAALAGLDTTLRGAATNLTAVSGGLVEAVGAGANGTLAATSEVVDPNPGASESRSGLLGAATGLPATVVDAARTSVEDVAAPVEDLAGQAGLPLGAQGQGQGQPGGLVPDALGPDGLLPGRGSDGLLPDGLLPGTGSDGVLPDGVLPGRGSDGLLPDGLLPGTGSSDGPLPERGPDGVLPGRGPDGLLPDGSSDGRGGAGAQPGPPPVSVPGDEGTGPIALPGADAPTPPRGTYGGFLPQGGFDDVPTPPSGFSAPAQGMPTPPAQTHLAGFSGAPAAPSPMAPMAPPAQPMLPPGQQFAPQPYSAQPFAGQHFGAPQAPYGGAAPAPGPGPQPQAPPGMAPVPPRGAPAAPAAPGRWAPMPDPQPYPPQGRPPEPVRPQPAAPVPLGSPRQERESIVALFLVHMFPIGHLPVAADRPARQLPVPDEEATAVWLRFPPHDHPRSDLVDPGHALAWLRNGWRQPAPPPAEVLPCPPSELTEGYDPLAEFDEREWDRRYVVQGGEDCERPEYSWPPGEQYPEGGCEDGEPVVLAEGTLLDRFGTAHGRVFAADGTPFARRSLPPGHLDAGYRRYRVVREVPMWKADSAGWFGQQGGGERYRAVYSAAELVTLGYLADITFEERA
ncbi:TNT domain-containing protein [Prauserella cavernicola]|uniref:TNT domain-containing protein n=1 Tax=Prauserella cavernicola TaxID=2800127 RepID=A0A934R102_9PSEU|nr:TNT domain-containing protein [Prauserella cavernicola]MBK1788843.1 TNT domain-containing protein [Prauserella cavernicola]